MDNRPLNIAMLTEFFYPRCGGVEIHVLSICKELIKKGHHVIVITRYEDSFLGVREIAKDLRVYYLPLENMTMGTIFPYFFMWLPILRRILKKEKIDIVHFHQCTSVMMHTSIREIELLGIHTVYTDHSIMSTRSIPGITMNKVFQSYSCNIHAYICVSHANACNFLQRQQIQHFPPKLHIIPNGVHQADFHQNEPTHPLTQLITNTFDTSHSILVGVLSRLVVRKGVFLLIDIITQIVKLYTNVHFIIAGGGEESIRMQSLAEQWNRHGMRVLLLGEIPHADVPAFLSCSDIFLSCSLTESFNITLLEAFVSGCILVSTNVGGVPELLPSTHILLTEPTVEELLVGLENAISLAQNNQIQHPRVLSEQDKTILEPFIYNWSHITNQVIDVYRSVLLQPRVSFKQMILNIWKQGFGTFVLMMIELFVLVIINAF